ncbi:hypothetical protein ES703_08671 [subsurface metagenome]
MVQGGSEREVAPYPEQTYRGFEEQVKLRGERLYNRRIARMKQLGLIERSNPGNIQEQWASQFQRIGASWWDILKGWIQEINVWVGPLIDLYKQLEEAGIITKEERDKAENEGWTKEQLISLIRAQAPPAWERYLPWITVGGLGIGLVLVLALRK